MSYKLTDTEIALLDEILLMLYDGKETSKIIHELEGCRVLNIDSSKFVKLNNILIDIGDNESFITKSNSQIDGMNLINSFDVENCNRFISNGGFKRYFDDIYNEQNQLNDHNRNLIENAKPKHWTSTPEFKSTLAVGLITVLLSSSVPLYIYKKETDIGEQHRKRTIEILDSMSMVYRNQFDTFSSQTKSEITNLVDSLNTYSLDSIKQ